MTRKVITIGQEETLKQVAAIMARRKIGSLLVVDGGKTVGIITEGDLSRAIGKGLDPKTSLVKSVMSKKLITTTPAERIEDAAKRMADAGVKKLPVLEDGKLVGMVTQTDIVASSFDLVNTLKELVRARYRPPDFQP